MPKYTRAEQLHTQKNQIKNWWCMSAEQHSDDDDDDNNSNNAYKILSAGNNISFTLNCNYRISATLYTLETWFVSGM
jgi:hypothetical protein